MLYYFLFSPYTEIPLWEELGVYRSFRVASYQRPFVGPGAGSWVPSLDCPHARGLRWVKVCKSVLFRKSLVDQVDRVDVDPFDLGSRLCRMVQLDSITGPYLNGLGSFNLRCSITVSTPPDTENMNTITVYRRLVPSVPSVYFSHNVLLLLSNNLCFYFLE